MNPEPVAVGAVILRLPLATDRARWLELLHDPVELRLGGYLPGTALEQHLHQDR